MLFVSEQFFTIDSDLIRALLHVIIVIAQRQSANRPYHPHLESLHFWHGAVVVDATLVSIGPVERRRDVRGFVLCLAEPLLVRVSTV
jgi:hypothetical protein